MVTMLEVFIRNSEDGINAFRKHVELKDWLNIGETAHKLISSYRHLELVAIVGKLINIKDKALSGADNEDLPELVDDLILSMEEIIDALRLEISITSMNRRGDKLFH
jgi:hypothetical protein